MFKEMGEAFPSLVDEKGVRKPFEQFLKDVRKVDETYNKHYLRAEYEFAAASAEMAAKWERFMVDGDRYNLQYRTAGDDRVRPEHAALNGVTLPPSDEFWESYYPPNGWRCRCTVVQVRKTKYPATPHDQAMALGEAALDLDKKGMFRFNPGKQERVFPAYNAYTQEKCKGCKLGGKATLGKVEMVKRDRLPNAQLCDACRFINHCATFDDAVYGSRLKIAQGADLREISSNRRAAAAILDSFDDVEIKINPHFILPNLKNPEYTINGLIGDRKGIHGYKGIATAFKAAKDQGCNVVVIDLDEHMSGRVKSKIDKIAQKINFRYNDFLNHEMEVCYVVCNNSAIRITLNDFDANSKKSLDNIRKLVQKIAR